MRHVLLLLCFYIPFTVVAQKPGGLKTYTDATRGLSIQYPANWEPRKIDGTVFFIARPKEEQGQKFAENINLIIDPPDDLSLDEYGNVARERLPKQLKNYKELKYEKLTLGGREFFRLFYTFSYNNLQMHDVYYVTVHNNCSYNFSCSALESTYQRFFPVFQKMLASFKVK